ETGFRRVVGVRPVSINDAGIPRRARVYGFVTSFLPAAVAVENRVRPRLAVAETRRVVVGEDAEYGDTESDGGQLFHARRRDAFGILEAQPAEMRRVDELRYAGVHCRHHRLRAHRVDLNPHAGFLRFVDRRPEI